MRLPLVVIRRTLLFSFFGLFLLNKAQGQQTPATTYEKAHALIITQAVYNESVARRAENNNTDTITGSNGSKFAISGPTPVDRSSKQAYTLMPPAPVGFWWFVSNGTVFSYYDDMIIINFNTSAAYVDIKLFDQYDYLVSTYRVTLTGDVYPLSAGAILTGSQSVNTEQIASNIFASTATGGYCSGSYTYQWQYSYNDTLFYDIEDAIVGDSLIFEGAIGQTTYFRRKVVCGADSTYTASVAVFLTGQLYPGVITTPSQTIVINTVPPTIQASNAKSDNCGNNVQYQWQQSADGYSFTNISGASSVTLIYPTPLTGNVFFRRKVSCDTVSNYTNVILIKVKSTTPQIPPVVKNSIDSLLEISGINIAQMFNLYNDSISNNRPAYNAALDSMEMKFQDQQQLFNINNTYSILDQAEITTLLSDSTRDNTQARISSPTSDSIPVNIPTIDSTILFSYLASQNYAGLDSLVCSAPKTTFEEAFLPIEAARNSAIPETQRTYAPTLNSLSGYNSAVINGPTLIYPNQTLHYTASFYFPLGNPANITWVVSGGTIISQNVNPVNGSIYADVLWQNTSVLQPYISIIDVVSNQYAILNPGWGMKKCPAPAYYQGFTYPFNQQLLYGQNPAILMVDNGTCTWPAGSYFTYQWGVVNIYQGATLQNIPGATSATYQPPGLSAPYLMYTRLTKVYSSSGSLIRSFYSNYAVVQLYALNIGGYQNATGSNVPFNTVPQITQTMPAYGGMLVPPGGTYSYTWEASINGGSWQQIGTGAAFPNYPITQSQKVRWSVTITGIPASVYSLPEKYWKGTSVEIELNTSYTTQDYENRNYIRENTVLTRGINTWEAADQLSIDKKAQTTTYLDGLSRPIQVVGKGTHYDDQTSQWYDMVQVITYEAGGRVDNAMLPYPTTDNSGKYKTNAATAQPAYYQSKFGDTHAYAKVEYDNSPLNKVTKSFAPGDSWVGANSNVSGDLEPYSNTESVHWFTISFTQGALPVNNGVYPSLFLLKAYGKDEKNKRVVTYTDRAGNIVLKKVQLNDDASLTNQHEGWLCTYYVYDDLGQLRFTITPKATKAIDGSWTISQAIADELCFWYDYDELGRVVAKKTPGKGIEYIAYDKRNRPVFTTDALASKGNSAKWIATFYDDLNRPVVSGLYTTTNLSTNQPNIAAVQSLVDNASSTLQTFSTTYGGAIKLWGCPLTAAEINNSSLFTQLSFKYYDGYTFSGAKAFNAAHIDNLSYKNIAAGGNVESNSLASRTAGMPTGSKVKILDNSLGNFLSTTVFYDEEGRIIQTQSDNIKGGVEVSSVQYHFDGRMLSSSETHNMPGTAYTNFNILTKYKFDKIGRVSGIGKKINISSRSYNTSQNVLTAQEDDDAGYKITVSYKYNELNRRVRKILSPNYNSGQSLETIDYTYNIRGWLTGINKDYALGEYNNSQWEHYFGMYLGYDNVDGKFSAGQLNGQITGVQWKSQGDNTPRKFDYVYDNANRLLAANFKQRGNNTEGWNNTNVDFSSKEISYDENGNLLGLTQMGIVPGSNTPVMIDKLTYQYQSYSNKLKRVDDIGNSPANGKLTDFKDGNNVSGTDDYSYDENGNLKMDQNKKIQSIQYNYLDLPEIIILEPNCTNIGCGRSLSYIYDAAGNKLQKISTETMGLGANRTLTTTYINGFVYDSKVTNQGGSPEPDDHIDALQYITHEEGRIRIVTPYVNPSDPANIIDGGVSLPGGKQGMFDYYIKDNLGNIRATITEEINKSASVCTMEDANATIKQYEESLFGNAGSGNEVNSTREIRPSIWTSAGTSDKVSKLMATGGVAKIGPNVILKVMAGDKISAYTDYYYATDPGPNNTSIGLSGLVNSFIAAIGSGRTVTLAHGQESQIGSSLGGSTPLQDMFNNPPSGSSPNTNAPSAYLNYIFFDEQFNFVKEVSGFKRVSQAGNGASPIVVTDIKAVKNGYVYVYLSNETGVPVYFDNFSVSHQRGQLISEDNYYAFGLKIAAISSKSISSSLNSKMVSHGYQGSFSEEVTDFELNYNEFELRMYDPQIGRWTTPDPFDEFASPYLGMGNDPINFNDPNGGNILGAIWKFFGGTVSGGASGFVGVGNACAALNSTSATCSGIATATRITMTSLSVAGAVYSHNYTLQLGTTLGSWTNGPGDDIPEKSSNPLLYTKERLKNDALNDEYYKVGKENNQKVILRQEYFVINSNNEVQYYQKTIVLNEGNPDATDENHKQTRYIYQRGTFTSGGDLGVSGMTTTYGLSKKTTIILEDVRDNTKPLNIVFNYHKGEILKSAEPAAENAAAYIATQLKLYPNAKARIIGNGDFSSDEVSDGKIRLDGKEINVNDILLERAKAVVKILIDKFGIDPSRLTPSIGTQFGGGASISYIIK